MMFLRYSFLQFIDQYPLSGTLGLRPTVAILHLTGEALYRQREESDDAEHQVLKCLAGERDVLVVALNPADAIDSILLKKDERLAFSHGVRLFFNYPRTRSPLFLSSNLGGCPTDC